MTTVEAVAAATGRATTDLPPFQDTIDSDALGTPLDGWLSAVAVAFGDADAVVSVTRNDVVEVQVDGRSPGGDDE